MWFDSHLVGIWFLANLFTGLAYLHIPFEIWYWVRDARPFNVHLVAFQFQTFIFFCGLHHLVMITTYAHHPVPWYQVLVDSAMALISVAVAAVLYHIRPTMRGIIQRFAKGQ